MPADNECHANGMCEPALSTQCSYLLFKILFLNKFIFIIHLSEGPGQ